MILIIPYKSHEISVVFVWLVLVMFFWDTHTHTHTHTHAHTERDREIMLFIGNPKGRSMMISNTHI